MTSERGRVVVIAGPAGVGKNSVIKGVMKYCPPCADFVTATTRKPRNGEQHGIDYYFFTPEEFDEHVKKGNIPEVKVHPNGAKYGTFLPYILEKFKQGKVILGDVTVEGAQYHKKTYGALTIFVAPPSFDVLEKRIRGRNADMPEDELKKRLDMAKKEIEEEARWYDYRVVNEEGKLDETVHEVVEILKKEGYLDT